MHPRSINLIRGLPFSSAPRRGAARRHWQCIIRPARGRVGSAILAAGLVLFAIIVEAFGENPKTADGNRQELQTQAPTEGAPDGRILAASADPVDSRPMPGTQPIYSLDFGEPADVNYDDWPDHWTRRVGQGFPAYLKMEIVAEPSPDSPRSFLAEIDGGGVAAFSPPIQLSTLFSHVLEVWVRAEGIRHDRVFTTLSFFDSRNNPVHIARSVEIVPGPDWRLLRLGPLDLDLPQAESAVVGLHVEPREKADLQAKVWFGKVSLGRLPRLSVRLNRLHGLYQQGEGIQADYTAAGISLPAPPLELEILGPDGDPLEHLFAPLEVRPAFGPEEIPPEASLRQNPPHLGVRTWNVALTEPGYYVLRATLSTPEGARRRVEVPVALLAPLSPISAAPFGWSLPRGADPLDLRDLLEVIRLSGVKWIKFPLWTDAAETPETLEGLGFFLERLRGQGVQTVGLLCQPPAELRGQWTGQTSAAEFFAADTKLWQPSLELTLARFGLLVGRWQLGRDDDLGFAAVSRPEEIVRRVSAEVSKVLYDGQVGTAWDWLEPAPLARGSPFRSLQFSTDPPMTPEELRRYLASYAGRENGTSLWVDLRPLDRGEYPLPIRITDLVLRMAAVKANGAQAGFHPDPFAPRYGLFRPDGFPTEMLIPWRTAVHALGDRTPRGSVRLPGASQNLIFGDGETGMMIVWNQQPREEVLFLGEAVSATDVWGRTAPLPGLEEKQRLRVGPLPQFLEGVNLPVAFWRQNCQLGVTRVPSVYGKPMPNQLRFRNTFPQAVSGTMRLPGGRGWRLEPDSATFKLLPNEEIAVPFLLTLPLDAEAGVQPFVVHFSLQAERRYEFDVFHTLEVGLGDVYVDVRTRLNAAGELEVQQTLVNETDAALSFRCELFAPDRRRQRAQLDVPASGRVIHVYALPDGRELLGRTIWLRAEELGQSRVLNHRVTAVAE
ncbi:MAG: hypothetical protein ACUVQQ_11800 [Thermogutta sp.]